MRPRHVELVGPEQTHVPHTPPSCARLPPPQFKPPLPCCAQAAAAAINLVAAHGSGPLFQPPHTLLGAERDGEPNVVPGAWTGEGETEGGYALQGCTHTYTLPACAYLRTGLLEFERSFRQAVLQSARDEASDTARKGCVVGRSSGAWGHAAEPSPALCWGHALAVLTPSGARTRRKRTPLRIPAQPYQHEHTYRAACTHARARARARTHARTQ